MALSISSLNSGSNANCYYIGTESDAILVDAGLSCRETVKRMERAGLSISSIRAIFVSHEHSDHISGVPGLAKKFQLPVYFSTATYRSCNLPIQSELVRYFTPDEMISVGSLQVKPFPKLHDAIDPHSFMVYGDSVSVGVFTDIGSPCSYVRQHFSECNAVFLESNYCEQMLANGNYPPHLKKRISGNKGHLSNTQALELFLSHRGPALSHLLLSHLSKNNNRPELVDDLFRPHANGTLIHVASRYKESPVYTLDGNFTKTELPAPARAVRVSNVQLRLF